MLVRGGSNRLDELSSEGESKNQSFLLPFPLSGHQEVPLTFRAILHASDNLRSRKSHTEVPNGRVLVDSIRS